jgi:hypothetical protein
LSAGAGWIAADTITIDLDGDDTRTVRRTASQPVRSIKAHRPWQRAAGSIRS